MVGHVIVKNGFHRADIGLDRHMGRIASLGKQRETERQTGQDTFDLSHTDILIF